MPTRRELLKGAAGGAFALATAKLAFADPAAAGTQIGPPGPMVQAINPFTEFLQSRYIDPDRIFSSDVRWWLGDASHTDETLLEEIQALYDGGFRGVELAMQND